MILKEIFKKAKWQKVAIELVSKHPDQRKVLDCYQEVFARLIKTETPRLLRIIRASTYEIV